MDEKRICDYFVITGIPLNDRSPIDEYASQDSKLCPFASLSSALAPITDIVVIIPSQGETIPKGYHCIETTPLGFSADLNHGSFRSPSIFLCYKRGTDKPPLLDIGVIYEAKELLKADSEMVKNTFYGRPANVNNGTSRTYLTFRRAKDNYPCNQLVVTDICVILANKGETPPHAFCLIERNLNKSLLGSDVFICYKKSMNRPPLIRYQPRILGRFPLVDYSCYSLPEQVPLFCEPMGFTIECWPKLVQQPRPTFSTFVLTSNTAIKVYGAVVTFFEKFNDYLLKDEERRLLGYLTEEDRQNSSLHSSKSICILSRWPFFDTFEKFLIFLHRIACCTYTPQNISIEKYISHFMLDVPFPSIQRPKILVQLGYASDKAALISQPSEDLPLPLSGASFSQFLRTLGSEKCITVFLLVLTEQKILLHSLRPDLLTSVAEALTSLIFPFHWQCPYIPLCPLILSLDVLNAPLPFIVGVDSRYFDISEPPADVVCVDLDTNSIYISEQKRIFNIKLFPKRPTRVLKNTLDKLYKRLCLPQYIQNGSAYNSGSKSRLSTSPFSNEMIAAKKQERQIDLEIQESFVRFMASILKSFRSYLRPITKAPTVDATDTDSLFDFQGFLKSKDKAHQRFYHFLMKTQMFTRFIEERSFVSDKDTCLAFFDECLDKIEINDFENALDLSLLDVNETSQNDRTVFIPAPEPSSSEVFIYTHFGPLDEKNFHKHPVLLKSFNHDCPDAENISRSGSLCPISDSPMPRRTKQEIRSAQRIARRHAEAPLTWAKCLVSYCYSLWFIHLPSYVIATQTMVLKAKQLKQAFDVLLRMQSLNLHPPDEVCYRILMLLCGVYSQPILAVKILFEMKRSGVIPNAITYGYYNKAVLESKWPSGDSSASIKWTKLRNVVSAISKLKKHSKLTAIQSENSIKDKELNQTEVEVLPELNSMVKFDLTDCNQSDIGYSSLSNNKENELDNSLHLLNTDDNQSLIKLEKKDLFKANHLRIRTKSIVRNSSSSLSCFEDYHSPAGVLMFTQCSDSISKGKPVSLRTRHRSTDQDLDLSISPLTSNRPLSLTCSPRSSYFSFTGFGNDAKIIRNIKDGVGNCKYLKSEPKTDIQSTIQENLEESENLEQVTESHKEIYANDQTSLISCSNQPEQKFSSHQSQNISFETKNTLALTNVNSFSNNNQKSEFTSNQQNFSFESSDTPFTPIKDAIINMNIFSPDGKVASTLRSSFRFANRFAFGSSPSKNSSISRSSTFHTNPSNVTKAKFGGKWGSFFKFKIDSAYSPPVKNSIQRLDTFLPTQSVEVSNEAQNIVNNVNSTQNSQPNFKHSVEEINSQLNSNENASLWTTKLTSGKHLEYVNSTIKSAANTMANRFSDFKNTIALSTTNSPSKMLKNQNSNVTSGPGSFLSQWASLVADKLPSNFSIDEDECNSFSSLDLKRLSIAASEDDISERSREGSLSLSRNFGGLGYNQMINIPPLFDSLDQHYHTNLDDTLSSDVILETEMTSCCRCNNCSAVLYDEEIMEFWSSDDSNLNTQCSFCLAKFVPLLTITLKYRRSPISQLVKFDINKNNEDLSKTKKLSTEKLNDSDNFEETENSEHAEETNKETITDDLKKEEIELNKTNTSVINEKETEFDVLEPFTVPYLSPIVLRKEFENVLESEGDTCVIKPEFADEHPIIYWNLIWYFKRINLPSHIITLCLKSSLLKNKKNFDENRTIDISNIRFYCLWDDYRLHHDCEKPMYYLWKESTSHSTLLHALVTDDPKISHNLMRQILASIQRNDMISAMKLLINERTKHDSLNVNRKHYSMYRDLLYLSFVALGRENIDQTTFDREYRRAYEALTPREQNAVTNVDKPPSLRAIFCRRIFKELELKPRSSETL